MPLSRTLLLYNTLSSKEKKELNVVMLRNKKISLKRLHNIVKSPKNVEKIKDKSVLFKQVLASEYNKKKDFLLRNEIRLYNKILKKIISNTHFEQNDNIQHQAFVNELKKRELDDILNFELRKKILEEEKLNNYYYLIQLYDKQIKLKKKNLILTSDMLSEFKEVLLKDLELKLNFIGESISDTAVYLAYVERVLLQINQTGTFTETIDNEKLFEEIFSKDLAFLNKLKTYSFQKNGEDKIKVLKEIIVFLNTTDYNKINKVVEIVSAQQALATEHMLLGDYSQAIMYFELCLKHTDVMSQNFVFGLSLNYISALVKARNFDKASDFIIENDLHKSVKLNKRFLPVFIICFILNNKIEEAESIMPLKFNKDDLDYYHYLRILHCIILYENKLFELANNEAENLKKHLANFSDKSNEMDNIISDFVISFIRIEFQYINEQKVEKRNKLKQDLERFSQENKNFDSDSLIIIWLNRQLFIQ